MEKHRITVGDKSLEEILHELNQQKVEVGQVARYLISKASLFRRSSAVSVNITSVQELGLPENTSLKEIERAACTKGMEPCGHEIALQFWLQNQGLIDKNHAYIVVSRPIPNKEDSPCLFCLQYYGGLPYILAFDLERHNLKNKKFIFAC